MLAPEVHLTINDVGWNLEDACLAKLRMNLHQLGAPFAFRERFKSLDRNADFAEHPSDRAFISDIDSLPRGLLERTLHVGASERRTVPLCP